MALNERALIRELASAGPSRAVRTVPDKFTPEMVEAIYTARQNGTSWKDINNLLERHGVGLKNPGTVSVSVRRHAEKYGIPIFKVQQGRPKTAAAA